jgi:CelD/BcsL family acetyltransferase involved in cellulose biosynthesis
MVRVEYITTAAGIDRIAPEWKLLWRRVPNATPFQAPEWLLSWWDWFGTSAPAIVTARDENRLIAVLPLYLLDELGRRKLLPFGISLSDYLDALVDPEYPQLGDTLLASLAEIPGWGQCYLPDLPLSAALISAECPPGLADDRSSGSTCPVLALPSAVEHLRDVVPRKTLRDLRQARHRAALVGTVTINQADRATVSAFMHEFFRLHEYRWQRVAGRGVCADPAVQAFHLTAAERLLEAGMLRLYLLRIGDRSVAAYYGFNANQIAYAYLGGFDPDCAGLSAGTQIVGHAIEEAICEGAREFHFLRGDEPYKYAWGAVDRPNTIRTLRRRC